MEKINYKKLTINDLSKYDTIPFYYKTNKKYELKKINNGLGGILLELVDTNEYYKDFGKKTNSWMKMFDLSNWVIFGAYNEKNEIIGGSVLATKTKNCHMLEGRNDLAVLWDLRVMDKYQHQGIGQNLFNLCREYAKESGFKQLKVECQNTNPNAVKFYHKQGMVLCSIKEYAYSDCLNEVQLLWYLDL